MADLAWEHAAEARAALNAIVTDPEHGTAALSSPRTMSNLLKDLLPDAPREKNLLVAAAEAGLADTLKEHVSQGMDSSTAISLTASSFSARSPLTPDACRWVTGEIAVALGISETNDAPLSARPGASPPGGAATEISPAYDSYPPGQRTSAERESAPDIPGTAQDGYSRLRDSAPPAAGSYPGGSAVVSPGQGAPGQGAPGQGAPSSYPSSPGYQPGATLAAGQEWPASQPPGQAGFQPGFQPGQGGYQHGSGYAPPGAGYAPGYSPQPAGYSPGSPPGYTPPTAFSPAENPQAYGPGVAAGMPAMTGAAYQPTPRPGISRRTNSMAVTALVLGILQFVGWIIFLLPGLLAAILAVVFGFVSMQQMRRSGEAGRGLAIAGVILGFLGILVVGILVAVGVASVNSQS